MRTSDADLALRWLAEVGITPLGSGRWLDSDPSGVTEMSNDDVASACAYGMVSDDQSGVVQRVQTALGLLDLTGAFEVMTHVSAYVGNHDDPAVIDAFWAGCRTRLEAADPIGHLRLSLRTDWFLGSTSEAAFAALLGDDVRRLATNGRLPELAYAVYGDLQPAEALTLLEGLRLPADTEGLVQLRKVLRKGAKNHYADPALWNA